MSQRTPLDPNTSSLLKVVQGEIYIKGRIALDRNRGLGYNTLPTLLNSEDLFSSCNHT